MRVRSPSYQGPYSTTRVKKLTEDVHEFQLTVELDGAIGQPFSLNKGHHVVSGRGDRPEEMAIGDALRGSACASSV